MLIVWKAEKKEVFEHSLEQVQRCVVIRLLWTLAQPSPASNDLPSVLYKFKCHQLHIHSDDSDSRAELTSSGYWIHRLQANLSFGQLQHIWIHGETQPSVTFILGVTSSHAIHSFHTLPSSHMVRGEHLLRSHRVRVYWRFTFSLSCKFRSKAQPNSVFDLKKKKKKKKQDIRIRRGLGAQ